ncbi:MAG: hypothetical protein ABGY41_21535, partial [Candidatus Poribacteria bacterium]
MAELGSVHVNGQAPGTRRGIRSTLLALLSAVVLVAALPTQSLAAPNLVLESPSPLLDVGEQFSVS